MFVIDTIIYSSFRQEITNVTETGGKKIIHSKIQNQSFIEHFETISSHLCSSVVT